MDRGLSQLNTRFPRGIGIRRHYSLLDSLCGNTGDDVGASFGHPAQ